jgi:hypothetical protein
MKYYQIKLMKYYEILADKSLIHNKPGPDIITSIAKKYWLSYKIKAWGFTPL